jgi:hypothetical protein
LLVNAAAMGILLNISRRPERTENHKLPADRAPHAEASAMLVTEANFTPEKASRRRSAPLGAEPEVSS